MGKKIIIVQGAQYGSEAKGAIAGYLCEKEGVDVAVRTGATNAGHTVFYGGTPYKMQQLPVGWVNPATQLVLGAGTLIDPEILDREVEMVSAATGLDIRSRLIIDYRCGIHLRVHADRSRQSNRHVSIGATGKGCSEALIDKIRGRGDHATTFGRTDLAAGYQVEDTAEYLNRRYDQGAKILLEGTQGTLLDLHLGPYPYTTHKSTGAAQWLMECGLSPALPLDIVLVVRTFPIRVAGNSGPLPNEISWPILARGINRIRLFAGMEPLVGRGAIVAFEEAVRSQQGFDLPPGSDGLDTHKWAADDRVRYADALSKLHQAALTNLDAATVAELSKLFEFTTVTKKLRRVAALSTRDLTMSGMLNRPHRLAVTFMNYAFPQYWLKPVAHDTVEMAEYLTKIEMAMRAPVAYTSWGPESHHVVAG